MKMSNRLIGVVILLAFAVPIQSLAQAQLAKEVIEEGVELIFRRASKDAAKELGEMGGKAAVREVLEKSANEGGEALVKSVTAYGLEDGAIALRVLGRSPRKMTDAFNGLAPTMRNAALGLVERQPQLLTRLTEQYGTEALEAAVRHPGVGEGLLDKLGREGIKATRSLTTDQAIIVGRHADEIAKLPELQRTGVLHRIATGGKAAVDFLEAHPKVLLTTAGVTAFIEVKDDLVGIGGIEEETNGGVTVRRTKPTGFLPRLVGDVGAWIAKPAGIAVTGLTVVLVGWISLKLWAMWRMRRAEVLIADAKAAAAINVLSMPHVTASQAAEIERPVQR